MRSTAEVFNHHLSLAQAEDLETDLARNLAPDIVLLTSYGTFRGHGGVRAAASLLHEQLGGTGYHYRNRLWEGEVAFLEWSAATPTAWIEDGADSFWIRDGLIRVMTIHYTVHKR